SGAPASAEWVQPRSDCPGTRRGQADDLPVGSPVSRARRGGSWDRSAVPGQSASEVAGGGGRADRFAQATAAGLWRAQDQSVVAASVVFAGQSGDGAADVAGEPTDGRAATQAQAQSAEASLLRAGDSQSTL